MFKAEVKYKSYHDGFTATHSYTCNECDTIDDALEFVETISNSLGKSQYVDYVYISFKNPRLDDIPF